MDWNDEVKITNRLLYDVQKIRISLGNMILAKKGQGIPISKRMQTLCDEVEQVEQRAEGVVKEAVQNVVIWDYMKSVKGIGPKLASSLIAEIRDISRFNTISSLWAYFGLSPEYVLAECSAGHKLMMSSDKRKVCPVYLDGEGKTCGCPVEIKERIHGKSPKRKAGYVYLFNTRGKMISWKIAMQFVKQGDQIYREVYYKVKAQEKERNPEISDGHAHNRALRSMVKIFLANLWIEWRKREGLPVREPYVIDKLGHTTIIR